MHNSMMTGCIISFTLIQLFLTSLSGNVFISSKILPIEYISQFFHLFMPGLAYQPSLRYSCQIQPNPFYSVVCPRTRPPHYNAAFPHTLCRSSSEVRIHTSFRGELKHGSHMSITCLKNHSNLPYWCL